MAFLNIEGLKVSYGSIKALKGIDLAVNEGEIVTLIGSNGAGKSTTMNAISGLLRVAGGKIEFDGVDIANKPSDMIVKMGLIQSPEGRQVFPRMTVRENLMMGAFTLKSKEEKATNIQKIFDLFPILKEREKQMAGTLSGGEQQMLAVGRAVMSNPKLLMLDEPSLGLAPLIIKEIFSLITRINKELGTTILLVEQNARMALSISDYGFVLETGKIIYSGKGSELLHDQKVREAYLGGI
ncbi:ABC transporter ATP-binding protein [Oscillospiraceae bacterium MB08-C2-2]|nr:ABC transporter ATP-binding protein [Oscillospiraceae bacterium MB08-C2-2]